MSNFDLNEKQVESILRSQCFQAVDRAFKDLAEKDKTEAVIKAQLKADIKRILRGEIVYTM